MERIWMIERMNDCMNKPVGFGVWRMSHSSGRALYVSWRGIREIWAFFFSDTSVCVFLAICL